MKKIVIFLCLQSIALCCFAQSKIDSLEIQLLSMKEDSNKVMTYIELARNYRSTDLKKVLDISKQALDLSTKINYQKGIAQSWYNLAVAHYFNDRYDSLYVCATRAIEVFESIHDGVGLNGAYSLMGSASFNQGNFSDALIYGQKAMTVAQKYDDEEGVAYALQQLGNVQWRLRDSTKALHHFENAFSIFEKYNDSTNMAVSLSNMAMVTPDKNTSLELRLRTRDIYQNLGNFYGLAVAANNLGSFYQETEEPQKALAYYLEAKKIAETYGFMEKLLTFNINIASVYGDLGNMEAAEPIFQKSIKEAQANEMQTLLMDAYTYAALAYEKNGNYAKAVDYLKAYTELNDSIYTENIAAKTAENETLFKTLEKEKQLTLNKIELEHRKNVQKNIIIGGILILLFLTGFFQYFRNRLKIKQQQAQYQLELEQVEADNLRQLDTIKSNFFANISHEFRTPLTLILSPLEQMLQGNFQGDHHKYFRIMQRNGKRLLLLVNQLLDLSRLESGKMTWNWQEGNLTAFVKGIVYSFDSLADRKQIKYVVNVEQHPVFAKFDQDKMEKILVNLLSNAFKFTPEEGTIHVSFFLKNEKCTWIIEDHGIGIPKDRLPFIFDRFYSQIENQTEEVGSTGIGLALAKELVELHHGTIDVTSEIGKGTTFTVELPLEIMAATEVESPIVETPQNRWGETAEKTLATSLPQSVLDRQKLPIVLVVEDNQDVREYIKDQLMANYQILEAANGAIGLKMAEEQIPDLIISDVVMPEMNGIELCNSLKTNELTSHIPVVMLTAKVEQEDKLEGLKIGADSYLTKPFDYRELNIRIENLIAQRQLLRKKYTSESGFTPTEIAVTSLDEQFLQRVKACIEKNLDEESFSVVDLSEAVNMSRSQLHRKLKALTDFSPNQIIREMRLIRAKELLEKGAGNATEVAFMVGFSSGAYFSKCFKDKYGIVPTQVMG